MESEKKDFLEAYAEFKKSSSAMVDAIKNFQDVSKETRTALTLAPLDLGSKDIENFDPARAHATGDALLELSRAHAGMASAMLEQSARLVETANAAHVVIAIAAEDNNAQG